MLPFNIKIGSSLGKKNKFSLDGKSSSTTHFGHVWPIACRHFVPDSKLKYDDGSIVRLSPLSAPVFGECKFLQYGVSVLYSDLYRHFDNFLAGQPISTSDRDYIPSILPSISRSVLTKMLMRFGTFTVYHCQIAQDGSNDGDYVQVTKPTFSSAIAEDIFLKWLLTNSKSPIFFEKGSAFFSWVFHTEHRDFFRFAASKDDPGFSTPSSCDIRLFVKGSDLGGDYAASNLCFCFRFSRFGCNIRKVLLGLGYKLSLNDDSPVSLFELFAFYKAYFDVFENKRIKSWTETRCFRLIDTWIQKGYGVLNSNSNFSNSFFDDLFVFFEDIGNTYYTKPSDIFSSVSDTILPTISSVNASIPLSNSSSASVSVDHSALPKLGSGGITADAIRYMQRLTTFVTKSSVVGKRLDTLLKKLYGVDTSLFPDSPIVGKSSVDVSISDVVSTSETESGFLGEYAGVGVGKNSGLSVTLDGKHYGIFIVLGSVVPDANWTNGMDLGLLRVRRFDFFNSSFDAVGYEMLPVKSFYDSRVSDFNGKYQVNPVSSLGFVPRYSSWKVSPPDVINGDMSRLGTRDSYLPYMLDNVHSDDFYKVDNLSTVNVPHFTLKSFESSHDFNLLAPHSLRYVGKFPHISNFDRIFRNAPLVSSFSGSIYSDYTDDLVFLNTVFKCNIYAPMKQISESMDTDPDNYATEVNKS